MAAAAMAAIGPASPSTAHGLTRPSAASSGVDLSSAPSWNVAAEAIVAAGRTLVRRERGRAVGVNWRPSARNRNHHTKLLSAEDREQVTTLHHG